MAKTVLITAGAQGIGREMAAQFDANGAVDYTNPRAV